MRHGASILIRHGLLIVPLVILVSLAIAGEIGVGYGFPNLFRDHPGEFPGVLPNARDFKDWQSFWQTSGAQVAYSATLLFGLVWVLALLVTIREEEPGNTHPIFRAGHAIWPAVFILSLFAVLAQQFANWIALRAAFYDTKEMPSYFAIEIALSLIGVFLGLIFVYAALRVALWIARKWRLPQVHVAFAVGTLITVLFMLSPALMPGFAVFNVLALLAVLYMSFALFEAKTRLIITLAVMVWSVICGALPLKHNFSDLKRYNDKPAGERPKLFTADGCAKSLSRQATASQLVTSLEYLKNWHINATKNLQPGEKPVFVVVAASGGAYRATYWTALVLDRLLGEVKSPRRFKDSVGLMTGASGGMVASAYFAALSAVGKFDYEPEARALQNTIDGDVVSYPRGSFANRVRGFLANARRDSLTPVIQRQLQYDVPSTWWPSILKRDRGEVLQEQWRLISETKFADLLVANSRSFSPAIIFSPMLVDSGRPLLISNLNLSCIAAEETHAVELFRMFPEAQKVVSLATAVRMSASFPYISPAGEIPTEPPQRVLDAGYYDNDGITTAAAFLQTEEVKEWLSKNVARVVVLRINAFNRVSKAAPACRTRQPAETEGGVAGRLVDSIFRSSNWFSSPIEGAWVARDTRARFSNRQTVDGLKASFDKACIDGRCNEGFIQEVELAYNGEASESWHLPTRELCNMRLALSQQDNLDDNDECTSYYSHKLAAEDSPRKRQNPSCDNDVAIQGFKELLAKP